MMVDEVFTSGKQATFLTSHHASVFGCRPSTFASSVIISLGVWSWSWSCGLDNLERSFICFSSALLQQQTTLVGRGRQVYFQS